MPKITIEFSDEEKELHPDWEPTQYTAEQFLLVTGESASEKELDLYITLFCDESFSKEAVSVLLKYCYEIYKPDATHECMMNPPQ